MTDSFLETLYREMYPKLYAFARVRLQDEQLAQEIAQDVFVLAQEKLPELRQSPNPQGWLIKAAGYAVLQEHMSKEEWKLLRAVYCEGYSIAEAARLCNMSFEACRKRLYRCKKRLRQELAAERKEGSVHV